MAPRSRVKTYQRALFCAVFAVGLSLGACGGDDDDDPSGGSSGSLNLSGASNDSGSSTGAMTSGGSSGQSGAPTDTAGGENATVAGSANGGGSSGGSTATGGNIGYLPCASAEDCKQYGGGKVCCDADVMVFCTKPSACAGKTLP